MRKQMWPIYQSAIRDLFEKIITNDEAEVVGAVLRRLLDAGRGQQNSTSAAVSAAAAPPGEKRLRKR